MKVTRVGLDLAKQVFQVHGVDEKGRQVLSRQLKRGQVEGFFRGLEPCLVGMEACGGAHHWARVLGAMGHEGRLMAPQHVKPYVKGNKNDANDAQGICEAVGRPSMRFVALKTVEQQGLQALHRIRRTLVRNRTAAVNEIRGLLAEYGIVVAVGVAKLRARLPELVEEVDNGLPMSFRPLLADLRADLEHLDRRIRELDAAMLRAAQQPSAGQALLGLRGVGPTTATALMASLGDGRQFDRGRQASAWVGIVPGQHSSGGKQRLLGISKRGDAYLRTLLIHGARAVVNSCQGKTDPLSVWVQQICARRNKNVAAVALANKTMRIAWALLRRGEQYDPDHELKRQAGQAA